MYIFIIVIFVLPTRTVSQDLQKKTYSINVLKDIKPVSFVNTQGKPDGLFTYLFQEIAKKKGLIITYEVNDWKTGLLKVKNRTIDIMPTVIKTNQRDAFLDFPVEPVMVVWGQIFIHKSGTIKSIFDLKGKTIGVMKLDQNAENFRQLARKFNLSCSYRYVNNHTEIATLIMRKSVYAGVFVNFFHIKDVPLKRTSIIFNPVNIYFATGKGQNKDLLQYITYQLKEWKKDENSVYYYALQKYLGTEFYERTIIPQWIKVVILIIASALFIFLFATYLLNYLVKEKTKELSESKNKLKKSLHDKDLLLQEIHHRVKNNLNIITSIITMQSYCIEDESILRHFQDMEYRILTLGLLHSQLYKSKDFSNINMYDYLSQIINRLKEAYEEVSARVKIIYDMHDIYMNMDTAIPCGLLINEMVTNTFKYAFPGDRRGELGVGIVMNSEKRFQLTVYDTGVGAQEDVDIMSKRTLGMSLILMLVKQLDGAIDFSSTDGMRYNITFEQVFKEELRWKRNES